MPLPSVSGLIGTGQVWNSPSGVTPRTCSRGERPSRLRTSPYYGAGPHCLTRSASHVACNAGSKATDHGRGEPGPFSAGGTRHAADGRDCGRVSWPGCQGTAELLRLGENVVFPAAVGPVDSQEALDRLAVRTASNSLRSKRSPGDSRNSF
jgi:hypothetical protein